MHDLVTGRGFALCRAPKVLPSWSLAWRHRPAVVVQSCRTGAHDGTATLSACPYALLTGGPPTSVGPQSPASVQSYK